MRPSFLDIVNTIFIRSQMGCTKMLLGVFLLMCSTAFVTSIPFEGSAPIIIIDESISALEDKKNASEILADIFYQTTGPKFYVSKGWQNWQEAAKICEKVNMTLASITSQKEQLELYKLLFVNDLIPKNGSSGYWLSGHLNLDTGLFRWTAVNSQIHCWGWLPREPYHYGDLESCVELKFDAKFIRLGWNNCICEEKRKFICQQKIHDNKEKSLDQQTNLEDQTNIVRDTDCYWYYKNRSWTALSAQPIA